MKKACCILTISDPPPPEQSDETEQTIEELPPQIEEEVEECPGAHNHVVNIHVEPHQQHPVTKALGAETI